MDILKFIGRFIVKCLWLVKYSIETAKIVKIPIKREQ